MKTECAYDYVKIGESEKLCGEYSSYVCLCHAGYVLAEDGHNCKEGGCFFELNSPSGMQ
ncbi:hypothetical protein TELCIR_15381 [Teladorsagia circumcincta]|uniref:Complement Clr-like EGF domain-containing protein n=1 Tax=Teladorsagia circumcincta TaxID=45464 RepID=A0A2G9TYE0_TELCI|nr:hypothetical protein TELCIR_15381 [Teladorsagia circumcincta]